MDVIYGIFGVGLIFAEFADFVDFHIDKIYNLDIMYEDYSTLS